MSFARWFGSRGRFGFGMRRDPTGWLGHLPERGGQVDFGAAHLFGRVQGSTRVLWVRPGSIRPAPAPVPPEASRGLLPATPSGAGGPANPAATSSTGPSTAWSREP